MNWLRTAYRSVVDHLTKVLGILGAAVMSAFAGLMGIEPDAVHAAAQTYLGQNAAAKIGTALFVLVVLRGWYTGSKAKQK
jgi:hypothetical protein